MRSAEQVREGEHFVGAACFVLIVESAVKREEIVAGNVVEAIVAVERVGSVAHHGAGSAVGSEIVVVAAEGEREQIECVGLIAGFNVAEVHIHISTCFRDVGQLVAGFGIFRHIFGVFHIIVLGLIVVAIVETGHQFAGLCGEKQHSFRVAAIGSAGRDGAHHTLSGCRSGIHRHDIEDGFHPFGIVFGSRVGNHFNALNHACRNGFEHFFRIL